MCVRRVSVICSGGISGVTPDYIPLVLSSFQSALKKKSGQRAGGRDGEGETSANGRRARGGGARASSFGGMRSFVSTQEG